MDVHVVPLASVGREDLARVGGKAAGLGELLRAGLPVPPGFVIGCDAYRAHLDASGVTERIARRLEGATRDDDLKSASADIRDWIAAIAIGPPLVSAIDRALACLDSAHGRVAVRSSAVAEDLPGASFAGQHDSFLDLTGLEVLPAIRACWASVFSERALRYRLHNGFAVAQAAIACVVQRMVRAEFAGVAFTADPVTGERDRIVVNVVTGLGEALVSGRASADQYVLRKTDGSVLEVRTAGVRNDEPTFLRELARLCAAAERHFGAPQDVEWAYADSQLSLLQSRPITRLPEEPVALREAEPPILCYAERIREMVPSALTPLTADVALKAIAPAVLESLARQGLAPRALIEQAAGANRIVHGRLYLNLTEFRAAMLPGLDELAVLELLEHGRRPPLRALRFGAALALAARVPSVLVRLLPMLLNLQRLGEQACAAIDRIALRLEREDLTTWSDARLADALRLRTDDPLFRELLDVPQANALARGLGTPFYTALEWMTEHWAGEPPRSAATLVSGLTGLVEVDCAAALWDLAQRAKEDRDIVDALSADPETALERLGALPAAAAWLASFRAFLDRFGHRAIEEVELARPRFSEQPAYPLSVIANYLGGAPDAAPRAVEARRRAARLALEQRIFERLRRRALRSALLRFVLGVAQQAAIAGENTKFHIVRILAFLRAAALERGRRLADAGRLAAPADVFFLELDDLADESGRDFRTLVAARRADHARWHTEDAPRLIDARGRPVKEGLRRDSRGRDASLLHGVGTSPGLARGRVRIVRDPTCGARLAAGDILVAPYTDPAWTPLFLSVGAAVVETGSLLSHASIVARELGLPCVVAVSRVTELLAEGEPVEVDGTAGTVRRVSPGAPRL
jgi:pyruvate,water dikinase